MKMILRAFCLFVGLFFAAAGVLNADVLVYEGYDYLAPQTLMNKGTAIDGWGGAWVNDPAQNDLETELNSLAMTDFNLPTVGNKIGNLVTDGQKAYRDFGKALQMGINADYYSSVLVKFKNPDLTAGSQWFNVEFKNSKDEYTLKWGSSSLHAAWLGKITSTSQDKKLDGYCYSESTMLMVLKLECYANQPDQAYMMVVKDGNDVPVLEPTDDSGWTLIGTPWGTNSNIDRVRLSGGNGGDYSWSTDELRIGTQWSDVVKTDVNMAGNPSHQGYYGDASFLVPTTLTWTAGASVDATSGHQVYFGTDRDVVANATVADPQGVYQGSYDAASFAAGMLEKDTAYFWRVDEVSGGTIYKGNVWRVTTGDRVWVDNFESYTDVAGLTAVWQDWQVNGSGAAIDMQIDDETTGTVSYNSFQSMKYDYDSSFGGSEATYVYASPADWSTGGELMSLDVHFKGTAANSTAEQMYLKIEDSSAGAVTINYDGDSADLASESWKNWQIDLTAVSGVDLTSVSKMTIGFAGSGSGTGTMYFDGIALFGCRSGAMTEDLNGDCRVDLGDFTALVNKWLDSKPF